MTSPTGDRAPGILANQINQTAARVLLTASALTNALNNCGGNIINMRNYSMLNKFIDVIEKAELYGLLKNDSINPPNGNIK